MTPEEKAREQIDAMLVASGWVVQTREQITWPNLQETRELLAILTTIIKNAKSNDARD